MLAWSLFTAACGVATSFGQLLFLRVGVGVGEAGCQPAAQSLLADLYPLRMRAKALGLFALGSPIGAAVGLAMGGVVVDVVGWRWSFVLAGAPGLLIGSVILAVLRDPRSRSDRSAPTPLIVVLRTLALRKSFLLLTAGTALLGFVNYGAMAFATSYYLRNHAADLRAIGSVVGLGPTAVVGVGMGLFGMIGGGAGTYVGGTSADRFAPADPRVYARIPAVGSLLTVVGYLAMFSVTQGGASLVLFAIPAFFANLWNGPATLALQRLAGRRQRATAMAIVLFAVSVFGLGLGPLGIGALSDLLSPALGSGPGLQTAIRTGVLVGLLSAISFWLAGDNLAKDLMASDDAPGPSEERQC